MAKQRPIGIFDSGLGGLTVTKAISKALPNESLIYFGDTAHLPYGDKSPATIRHYASRITHFLLDQDCKMIVIACNTATALAAQTVIDAAGPNVPVVNVIDPVVELTAHAIKEGRVGVIGTKATISSGTYESRLKNANPKLKTMSLATPLLVPLIEEGFHNDSISAAVLVNYLGRNGFQNLDALILGCTHYPLIKKQVEEFYRGETKVLDSGKAVAERVNEILTERKLGARKNARANYQFFVSDFTELFEKSTRIFFRKKLHLEEYRLWKEE